MSHVSHNRLTRQEIKHDEFVSTVSKVVRWAEDHQRSVMLGGAGVLLALVLALVGSALWQARQEEALSALAEVEHRYQAVVEGEQPAAGQPSRGQASYASREEKFEAVLEAASAALDRFSSGPAARQSLYYRGLALRELGRTEEAVADFNSLLERRSDPLPQALAQLALAETYEAAGRWAEAARAYEALSSSAPDMFPREMALLGQARCLERDQRLDEARTVYRQVVDSYPGSQYAAEAEERLRQIG